MFSAAQQTDSAAETVVEPDFAQGRGMQTKDASTQVEDGDHFVVRSYDGVPGLGLAAGLSHPRGLAQQVLLGPPHASPLVGD